MAKYKLPTCQRMLNMKKRSKFYQKYLLYNRVLTLWIKIYKIHPSTMKMHHPQMCTSVEPLWQARWPTYEPLWLRLQPIISERLVYILQLLGSLYHLITLQIPPPCTLQWWKCTIIEHILPLTRNKNPNDQHLHTVRYSYKNPIEEYNLHPSVVRHTT